MGLSHFRFKIIFIGKVFLTILLTQGIAGTSFAQDFSDYHLLKSSGALPNDFTIYSYKKVRQAKHEIPSGLSHEELKVQKEFAVVSNYRVDELLKNGKVLFGDPVSKYISSVADQLLVNEPELRTKLRFYTVRSDVVNAFATHQGIVFVTTGLLSKLKNEAQLAFILSHEIVHYERKHVVNSYLNQNLSLSKGRYTRADLDQYVSQLSLYSKNLELEADSLGLLRFLKSDYAASTISETFDVLLYSEHPFSNQVFEFECMEHGSHKVLDKLHLNATAFDEIKLDSMAYEESHSHPSIGTRKNMAEAIISSQPASVGVNYLVGKEEFKNVQNICRFEVLHLKILKQNYTEAIYDAFLLQKDFPESRFLKEEVVKAMYSISCFKLQSKYYQISREESTFDGPIEVVEKFIDTIASQSFAALTLLRLDELCRNNSDNEFFVKLRDHLLFLIYRFEFDLGFCALIDELSGAQNACLGKYKPIWTDDTALDSEAPLITTEQTDSFPEDANINFFRSAFSNYEFTDELLQLVDRQYPTWAARGVATSEGETLQAPSGNLSHKNRKKEEHNKARRDQWQLGIDTLVIFDPFCLIRDLRDDDFAYQKAERLVAKLNTDAALVANRANVCAPVVSSVGLQTSDEEEFNSLTQINTWIDERMALDEIDMIPISNGDIGALIERYKTSKFYFSGVIALKGRRDNLFELVGISIALFIIAPFGIAYAFSAEYLLLYYSYLFDFETGKMLTSAVKEMNYNPNLGYLNGMLYEQLMQIKKTPDAR